MPLNSVISLQVNVSSVWGSMNSGNGGAKLNTILANIGLPSEDCFDIYDSEFLVPFQYFPVISYQYFPVHSLSFISCINDRLCTGQQL